MINQRKITNTFTGKELDAETGFHYFGARYYDSDLSGLFLSVDPMADKYPSISPYVYCAWNPVKLVDPNGKTIWIVNKDGERIKYTTGMKTDGCDAYTKETILALDKLCSTKTIGLKLAAVSKTSQFSIDIQEDNSETVWEPYRYEDNNDFLPSGQTINFCSFLGIEDVNTGEAMSPANCLGHEFGHFFNAIENTSDFFSRLSNNRDDEWSNDEELFNILNNEHSISLEWNELIRDGHKTHDCDGKVQYRVVKTQSSVSNKVIMEL